MLDAPEALSRLRERAREWRVAVDRTLETENSLIAFGSRGSLPAVLKVLKRPGDEWHSGEVVAAFAGNGCVKTYEHAAGALLLEHLIPGQSLVRMVLGGRDEEAVDILADVIQRMSSPLTVSASPTVAELAQAFERYSATEDGPIPQGLVEEAHRLWSELSGSQRAPRLLHGDFQHHNVLFDARLGWVAIDPKGVVGETEYEVAAALRNPIERADLFASSVIVERRLERFASKLGLDYERALRWAFAQAVLSAVWSIEDGFAAGTASPFLRLAHAIRPMLEARG